MFCSDYASQGHINELDQEFDSSMANLNKLLDQALDKVHPANDQPEENDANYASGNGTKDFEGNEGKLQSARTYASLQIDSQSLHEYMNRDVKNSPSAFQTGNQLWSPGKLITPKGLSNNKTYLKSLNKGSYSSEMSELQLEFKIDQNRIYESPLDTAQRSKALTERNHKGFKPDEIRTKPDSFHHHQRWASQYSFTNPLNDFLSPRDNDGSGFWSTDWLRNNQSRSDLNLKQERKISNSYNKSRTMSRTSEDNLQVSFQTDIEAKAAAQLVNKIQSLNKNENLATISINKNKQVNSSKKGSEEMEQIGECLEYENKSPEPTHGSLQTRKYNQKESRVTLDDSYGLKEELGGVVLNKTPKRQDGIKICYQESENSKHYSPNAYNSKSPYYKKPSIVQTPNKVNPLETRFLSPENSYISKKSEQFGSNRKEEQLSQFFDENIGEYERNLRLINKYATTEIIESLDQFPAEKEALIDSLIRTRKPSVMVSSHKNDTEIDNEGAKLVVMCSPIKQKDVDQNLVSVYQQVSEVYDDGAKYVGEKLLGKRHGKGTYYYKEGYKYEGSWEEDNMSGFGTLWLTEDLKWYEGEWLNNLFHGKGSLYNLYTEPLDPNTSYANDFSTVGNGWVKYDGQFVEGLKDGLGSLHFSNNDLYIGKFRRNKAEGRGAYTKADSFVVVGRWESDQLKETY